MTDSSSMQIKIVYETQKALPPTKVLDMSSVPVLNNDGSVRKDRYGKIIRTNRGGFKHNPRQVTFYNVLDLNVGEIIVMSEDELFNKYGKKTARKAIRAWKESKNV